MWKVILEELGTQYLFPVPSLKEKYESNQWLADVSINNDAQMLGVGSRVVVAHVFNPSAWKADAGGSL